MNRKTSRLSRSLRSALDARRDRPPGLGQRQPSETLTNVVHLIQRRFDDRRLLGLPARARSRQPGAGRDHRAAARQRRPRPDAAHRRARRPGRRTGAAVVVHDTTTHPRFKYFRDAGEDPYRSFLGVPVIDRGVLQGVLVVQTAEAAHLRRRRRPDARDGRRAAGAARQRGARASASSWRRSTSGWPRSRGTCGGAGTTRAPACSAISIPCSGASAITIRSRCCSGCRSISSSSARRSWRCTAASTTPTAGCRSTWRRSTPGARGTPACSAPGRWRTSRRSSACTSRCRSTPAASASSPATTSRARPTSASRSSAIGLFYDQGYFRQRLDRDGWQHEDYIDVDHRLLPIEPATARRRAGHGRDRDADRAASSRGSGSSRSAATRCCCSIPTSTATIPRTAS